NHSEEDPTNDGQRQSTSQILPRLRVRELIHLGTKNIQAPKKIPLIKTCDHSTHVPTSTPLASRQRQEAGPASLFRCYSKQETMRALMALLCSKFGVCTWKQQNRQVDFGRRNFAETADSRPPGI